MPYARPTFAQIKARIAAAIAAGVAGADGLLRYTNLGVIGLMQAAAEQGFYGYLDYIARQSVPFTATDEALEAWAALRKIIRKGAVAAGALAPGQVTFAATPPAIVPAGTPVVRADGQQFVTVGTATASGNSVTVNIQAAFTGALGNTATGSIMTLGSAVPNVQSQGEVTAVIGGGADMENDDQLRSRMLIAFANPPQGGSYADYMTWALQVAGVTRAWVQTEGMGPGTVVVFFMEDVSEAAHGGFPQGAAGVAAAETRPAPTATGDMLAVANAILASGQPVTALVYAKAPTANAITLTISGLGASPSSALQASITAAVQAVLLAQGSVGGTILPNGTPGVIDLSYIESAIAAVSGAQGFVITAVSCTAGAVTPGPDGNVSSNVGALPVLGAIDYVA